MAEMAVEDVWGIYAEHFSASHSLSFRLLEADN